MGVPSHEELAERMWLNSPGRDVDEEWPTSIPYTNADYRRQADEFIQWTALAMLAISEGHA